MKKVFVMALGILLILGFAAQLYAETKYEVTGHYRSRWYHRDNFNLGDGVIPESIDNHFDQRIRLNMTFMPHDNLTAYLFTEALNGDWGLDSGNAAGGGARTHGGYFGVADLDGSIFVRYAYIDIKSNYGTFTVGRQSTDVEGLALMGYRGAGPAVGCCNDVFDAEGPNDRIKWVYQFGPATVGYAFTKYLEGDGQQAFIADQDRDSHNLWVDYRFANGGVFLGYEYRADHNFAFAGGAPGTNPRDDHVFNPAAFMNFGPFRFGAELQYLTGSFKRPGLADVDTEGLGFYADGVYNFGPGHVGLQFGYFEGDDDPLGTANVADNEIKGQVGDGPDFFPFLIAQLYGARSVNTAAGGAGIAPNPRGFGINADAANYWFVGAHAGYSVTEDLLLGAGIGYFQINEVPVGWDDHFGTEFRVDLNYKIMPNLTFQWYNSYFAAGDFHKGGVAANPVGDAWLTRTDLQMTW